MKIYILHEVDELATQPQSGPVRAFRRRVRADWVAHERNEALPPGDSGHYYVVVPLELEE